jgi:hypothetical protein
MRANRSRLDERGRFSVPNRYPPQYCSPNAAARSRWVMPSRSSSARITSRTSQGTVSTLGFVEVLCSAPRAALTCAERVAPIPTRSRNSLW